VHPASRAPAVQPSYCSLTGRGRAQVYYELAAERAKRELEGEIAVVRVEQLAPFPFDLVMREMRRYPQAPVMWCAPGERALRRPPLALPGARGAAACLALRCWGGRTVAGCRRRVNPNPTLTHTRGGGGRCQEEPLNQGAYYHVAPRLKTCLQALEREEPHQLPYAGRPAAAATATGYAKVHAKEQAELLNDALTL
jgi:hypothetical protein